MGINKEQSKKRIRALEDGSRRHGLRNAQRITKYGVIGFGRNIWLSLTATLVMTLTLTIFFITIAASTVLSSTADSMRDKIDISIFFNPNTPEKELQSMAATMSSDPNVKSVEVSTTEQEYNKMLEEQKENTSLIESLQDEDFREIMMNTMYATMTVKPIDADDLSSIKAIVNNDEEFKENVTTKKAPSYDTNRTAIDTIASWANIARTGGLALSIIFLVVSILVNFNTIRMAIYSRSEEIYMEKLVGADNRFIRGPFLVESMMSGAIAGLLSGGIGITVINLARPKLEAYDIDMTIMNDVIHSYRISYIFLGLMLIGIIIAYISSRLAVRKYLKKV